jgi:hypothetical protein
MKKKEKTDKYYRVWRIWDNGALAFCGYIIFLSVFKLVRCVSCSPVNTKVLHQVKCELIN